MKPALNIIVALILFYLALSSFKLIEDPPFVQRLKAKIDDYNRAYPAEKIYLQFDKPFYKPGEDIWFNAFILNSNTHEPSTISDVVYVELVDPKGNVVSKLSLFVKEGSAHGDFPLPAEATGGLYQVKAFTQWMKNFGKENFFKKEIQVQRIVTPRMLLKLDFEKESYGPGDAVNADLEIKNLKNENVTNASIRFIVTIGGNKISESMTKSADGNETKISFQLPSSLKTTDGLLQTIVTADGVEESISRSIPIVLNKISLQFFPEGGHLVINTSGRIAFKAMNEFGKGADVSGTIVDENGNQVATFESFHMGMGAFMLTPVSGKKYFAKITLPSGNNSMFPLPEPLDRAFSLQLASASASVTRWTIHSPINTMIHMVGQSHGNIIYTATIDVEAGENKIDIPVDKFPAGIAVFTLFDAQGIERCERLVFLRADKNLNIKLTTNKEKYSPREKVDLKILTTDDNGKPTKAKISLSVVDDKLISFADDKQDNILSSMLLSSEVRGDVQEPSFYFDPNEPKASQALDYLLMTQGWRRFTWQDIRQMNKIIVYTPEKIQNLSGTVMRNGTGMSSDITLLELGNKRRIEKIQTTDQGRFIFKNVDPTVPILLLVKKPDDIVIQKEESTAIVLNDGNNNSLRPEEIGKQKKIATVPVTIDKEETIDSPGLNMKMEEDVTSLSEVVVTSFGYENKRNLSASVITVSEHDVLGQFSTPSLTNLLQGRVAGVVVESQSINPSSRATMLVRGHSSFVVATGEPLYVIDGFPLDASLNPNFSNVGIIGQDDIQNIEVIPSPEATSLYGCLAANGAILITTKSRIGYTPFITKRRIARYNSETIYPRSFSPTREFYVEPPLKAESTRREDFRTTLYWNHTIVTNDRGEAELSFYNNDAVSSFRLTAEGVTGSGLVGRTEETYFTQLPFSLDTKLPEFLGFEDTLKLPIRVTNETTSSLYAKVVIDLPRELTIHESDNQDIQVDAAATKTVFFAITTKGVAGDFPITITLQTPNYQDKIEHNIRIQPVGFPAGVSVSSRDVSKTLHVSIDDVELGTLKGEFVAFPDVVSDLLTGAEAILREPHGCFEQVSSSTFPNILVLQFLKEAGAIRNHVEKQAMRYIASGYRKLSGYEVAGGGFDWFGRPPANEGLTAFGLVEFHEMKKVFNGVDDKMVDRTREWLLSRRDGVGGFKTQHMFFDGISVQNAYITYALAETGTKNIDREYQVALAEALKSEDMYRMGLMACASHSLDKMDDYKKLVDIFKAKVLSEGLSGLKAHHSFAYAYGESLTIETVSLWTIALLRSTPLDHQLVTACIDYIVGHRRFGRFGSTQGTTLALKALTEYAKLVRAKQEDGAIQISVDNNISEEAAYKKETRDRLVLNNFVKDIKDNGKHNIQINFMNTKEALPYSVNINWYTKKPQSNDSCKVALTTRLNTASVRMNETVRLAISIKNKTNEWLPMTTAVVGIPAGLSLQPWQLKELQEKNVFDFYEIQNGNLILYYGQLKPGAVQHLNLDLKAELPGNYTGAASTVYLYYTDEYKDWVKGNSIMVY